MSDFICKKPLTLSGHSFSYGEVIPAGFVLPQRALALIRSNYITEVDGNVQVASKAELNEPIQPLNDESLITIPITTEKGSLELITSSQTITNVFIIMQKTAEEAIKDINALTDKDALILINAVDPRKRIQKVTEERYIQISEPDIESRAETEEGESTGDA